MNNTIIIGLVIPFIGTAAGSACVFFLKRELNDRVQRALTGFAAGVMVAASIWSLIVPAIEQEEDMSQGKHSNIGVVSFAVGFSLMMALDVALG